MTSLNYLGHVVSRNGIRPDPKEMKAIYNWPVPVTVTDIRNFLGFTSYYKRFIPKDAHIARPLNVLISGENALRKNKKVEWTK